MKDHSEPHTKQPQATLFYDGQCPLCTAEINQLKKSANKQLSFVDAHSLEDYDVKHARLKKLYLQQGEQCLSGLDANIAMWQYTNYGWLWRGLKLPLIYPLASYTYTLWAKRRYKNRYKSN